MRISIIVPAFNEERLLAGTLRAIAAAQRAFEERGWTGELIVCDNNSTDCTPEIARAAGAVVVFERFNQIARARNSGAAAASGDWLVFVDADSQPSRELFVEVADQIASGRCLAGGCTVRLEEYHPKSAIALRLWNCTSRALHLMAGSFIFCETQAFRNIGGFSNELFAGEELDLSRRLKKLARAERKRIIILHRHPILTSARKVSLYTLGEHLVFLAKVIFSFGGALNSRAACHTWYDGRR